MSPREALTISWAELLLVLLLVAGGAGAWTLTTNLLGPARESASTRADAASVTVADDDELRRLRTSLDRFQTALVQETVEISRQEALRGWLRERNPGLIAAQPGGTTESVAPEVRAADEAALRSIAVSRRLSASIEKEIDNTKSDIAARILAVNADGERKASAAAAARSTRTHRQQLVTRGMAAGAVIVVFALWCVVLTRKRVRETIQTRWVIGITAGLLVVIVAYELVGAPGLMVGAFGLAAVVLRAVVVRT